MRKILYITYDGLTDPLGQSQILAYLKRLSNDENKIVILSFEKEHLYKREAEQIRQITKTHNIIWVPLFYTKNPPILSTLYDVNKALNLVGQLYQEHHFDIVHCRGYIPSIIGRKVKRKYKAKFIFDMRGWWADEKKESGNWDKGIYNPVYRYFKKLESHFFKESDFAVSLTYKGREEIIKQGLAPAEKVGVIPTCVDFEIFKPWDPEMRSEVRKKLQILKDEMVFVYSGSIGGNYDHVTLIEVFKKFSEVYPNTFLLVLAKDGGSELEKKFHELGINRVAIHNAPFLDVTNYLRAADVGFIYYKMSFSTIGRSPTKLGEYWASGIPVIAFQGIGDLDHILEKYPASGVLLSPDKSKWKDEIANLSFPAPSVLRKYSEDYFHINTGVEFYQNVYESLVPMKKLMPVK